MAEVFTRTERNGEFYHRRQPSDDYQGDNDGDEIDDDGSAISDDSYQSDDDGAPDLEVEASPIQQNGDGKRPAPGADVDASFFSDYEAEVRSKVSATARAAGAGEAAAPPIAPPPPPLKASPLAKRAGHQHPDGPLTHIEADDGDGFYDAEYASSMRGGGGKQHPQQFLQRRASSPSPVPAAVVEWQSDKLHSAAAVHRDSRSSSWLDPLHSQLSPFAGDEGEEDDDGGVVAGRQVRAPHGLSDSPRRGSLPSPSVHLSDTPRSHRSSPSVTLREGTAAPPPHARGTVSPADLPQRRSAVQSSRDDARTSAGEAAAADLAPSHDARVNKSVSFTREVRRASLISPAPPSPPALRPDAQPATRPERPSINSVASPGTTLTVPHPLSMAEVSRGDDGVSGSAVPVVRAEVPGLRPLSTSHVLDASGSQTRVTRCRAPRGVPLLLQCTGHVHTPTRTVVIPSTDAEGTVEDAEEDEATVNAGLHTSAYRETSGMSDLLSTSSHEAPVASAERNARFGTQHLGRRTPERAAPLSNHHNLHQPLRGAAAAASSAERRRRVVRSKSPSVSLVDHHPNSFEHTVASTTTRMRQVSPTPSTHSSAPPSSDSSATDAAAAAPPDLVDFSVHTEVLGRSAQEEDSLVLCGYSVESFPISTDASRCVGADARLAGPHVHRGPQPQLPRPPAMPRQDHQSSVKGPLASSYESNAAPAPSAREQQRNGFTTGLQFQMEPERVSLGVRPPPLQSQARVQTLLDGRGKERRVMDESSLSWPSRELVYPGQAAERSDVAESAVHVAPGHPSQRFDVRYVVDSVEEATVMEDRSHAYDPFQRRHYPDQNTQRYGSAHGETGYASSETVSVASTAPTAATDYNYDELQQRRQQREAVRQLLARQTDSRRDTASRLRDDDNGAHHREYRAERSSRVAVAAPQQSRQSAAAYVEQQARLRAQRMAAEAERVRLDLALDVCRAVRPFGRDLLLMFLLLVEESNVGQRQRSQRRQRHHHSIATSLQGGGRAGGDGDAADWEENRVSYETCAEAINCVLERHGVNWIRATRELCHRVVGWCRGQRPASTANNATPMETREGLVEYATFVSCVMEFAADYHSDAM